MMNVFLNLAHSDNYGLMYHDTSELDIVVYQFKFKCYYFIKCQIVQFL